MANGRTTTVEFNATMLFQRTFSQILVFPSKLNERSNIMFSILYARWNSFQHFSLSFVSITLIISFSEMAFRINNGFMATLLRFFKSHFYLSFFYCSVIILYKCIKPIIWSQDITKTFSRSWYDGWRKWEKLFPISVFIWELGYC